MTEEFKRKCIDLVSNDLTIDDEFEPHNVDIFKSTSRYSKFAKMNNLEHKPYELTEQYMNNISENSYGLFIPNIELDAFYVPQFGRILFYGDFSKVKDSELVFNNELTYIGVLFIRFGLFRKHLKFTNKTEVQIKYLKPNQQLNEISY